MRLYIPYTEIQPATAACLGPYEHTPIKMINDDDYLRYFQTRWTEKESFINCEHDTVFWHGAIEELEQCPEKWCGFSVISQDVVWDQGNGTTNSSGLYTKHFVDGVGAPLVLTKFDKDFIEEYPDVWDEMAVADVSWKDQPKWLWCDSWLDHYMRSKGVVCHQHYPVVKNANPRYARYSDLKLEWTEGIW